MILQAYKEITAMPKVHSVEVSTVMPIQTFEYIILNSKADVKGDYDAYLQRQEMYLQQRVHTLLDSRPDLLIDTRECYQKVENGNNCLFLKVTYKQK